MRYSKFIKEHGSEASLLLLMAAAFIIYFAVYLTPSRIAWYHEMLRQLTIIYREVIHVL